MGNKCAILTGASRGLGREVARALAAEGVQLALVARSEKELDELARELEGANCSCVAIVADLCQPDCAHFIKERAQSALGAIDYLVNNAALESGGGYVDKSPEQLERVLQANLQTPMVLSRLLLPEMLERGHGQIVNVASLAGKIATPYAATYAASKAALTVWSKSLHLELCGTGVGSSLVTPGFVSDIGMYTRHQTVPPWFLRAAKPAAVVAAVLRALRENPVELVVSGSPFRPLAVLHALAPGLFFRLFRALGIVGFLKRSYESAGRAESQRER